MSTKSPAGSRPLSPFMLGQYYRFQWTSLLSFAHRITGIGLSLGTLLLTGWLVALAGASLPSFWLGMLLVAVFASVLFQSSAGISENSRQMMENASYESMLGAALGIGAAAFLRFGVDSAQQQSLHGAADLISGSNRWPDLRIDVSTVTLVVAGLLVGIGTRYGSGCTSGHGVCGLSRRSPRSLTATVTFMAAAFATVFVIRHLAAA